MKISEEGLNLIKIFEGCKLVSYLDSVGVPTIGFGHTAGVHGGMHITQAQADQFLLDDIEGVYRCIDAYVTVPLSQPQFSALCSWIFNLGCGNFQTSTLRRELNAGNYEGIPAQIRRWNHAGGQVLAGLTTRRNAEAQLFAQADPDATDPATVA